MDSADSLSLSLSLSFSLSLCFYQFVCLSVFPSLTVRLYQPLVRVGSLDGIQCPHRADECKSLLVGQHWCVYAWYYLPTPPLGQDMTQGQFLSGV